jgi:hypothetical protein
MGDAAARHAAVDELKVLRHLAQQSTIDRLTERGGAVLERLDPRPPIDDGRLVDEDVLLALGLYDEVALGTAHAEVLDVHGARIVRLYDVFDEPAARGVGIG